MRAIPALQRQPQEGGGEASVSSSKRGGWGGCRGQNNTYPENPNDSFICITLWSVLGWNIYILLFSKFPVAWCCVTGNRCLIPSCRRWCRWLWRIFHYWCLVQKRFKKHEMKAQGPWLHASSRAVIITHAALHPRSTTQKKNLHDCHRVIELIVSLATQKK